MKTKAKTEMKTKELSRKMYDEVPQGGSLFIIDKIGLQLETKHIRKENIEIWKEDNFITILTFGNTAQINIYAEYDPMTEHLGRRCFNAILVLLNAGVFNSGFYFSFMETARTYFPFICFFDFLTVSVLNTFFKVVEWEWAIDFLDYPLFSFMDIDTDIKNKNKKLKKYRSSDYSKDDIKVYRKRKSDGKSVSKGHQHSLICHYNRGEKNDIPRHIERVEIRQQGKYKKDLNNDLLEGNKDDALIKAVPVIRKSIKKVIHDKALILDDYWKKNPPEEYKTLFS
jgi:hypothetical protein